MNWDRDHLNYAQAPPLMPGPGVPSESASGRFKFLDSTWTPSIRIMPRVTSPASIKSVGLLRQQKRAEQLILYKTTGGRFSKLVPCCLFLDCTHAATTGNDRKAAETWIWSGSWCCYLVLCIHIIHWTDFPQVPKSELSGPLPEVSCLLSPICVSPKIRSDKL